MRPIIRFNRKKWRQIYLLEGEKYESELQQHWHLIRRFLSYLTSFLISVVCFLYYLKKIFFGTCGSCSPFDQPWSILLPFFAPFLEATSRDCYPGSLIDWFLVGFCQGCGEEIEVRVLSPPSPTSWGNMVLTLVASFHSSSSLRWFLLPGSALPKLWWHYFPRSFSPSLGMDSHGCTL